MNDEIVFDTMTEHYQLWQKRNDPITPIQRTMLIFLAKETGISINIDSLTYGTAADTLLYLSKQLRYR